MSPRKEHTAFYYFIQCNKGTWVLITVHLVILILLVVLFADIIHKMQGY